VQRVVVKTQQHGLGDGVVKKHEDGLISSIVITLLVDVVRNIAFHAIRMPVICMRLKRVAYGWVSVSGTGCIMDAESPISSKKRMSATVMCLAAYRRLFASKDMGALASLLIKRWSCAL
jgi:hypothetical protein